MRPLVRVERIVSAISFRLAALARMASKISVIGFFFGRPLGFPLWPGLKRVLMPLASPERRLFAGELESSFCALETGSMLRFHHTSLSIERLLPYSGKHD